MSKIHVATKIGKKAEYDEDQVKTMWEQGLLQGDALYWKEGMNGWKPISQYFNVTQESEALPPPLPTAMGKPCKNVISQSNRFQSPDTSKIASGQKLVCYAILIGVSLILFYKAPDPIPLFVGTTAFAISIIGIIRMVSGMLYSGAIKFLIAILMFLPVINLFVLIIINSRAKKFFVNLVTKLVYWVRLSNVVFNYLKLRQNPEALF